MILVAREDAVHPCGTVPVVAIHARRGSGPPNCPPSLGRSDFISRVAGRIRSSPRAISPSRDLRCTETLMPHQGQGGWHKTLSDQMAGKGTSNVPWQHRGLRDSCSSINSIPYHLVISNDETTTGLSSHPHARRERQSHSQTDTRILYSPGAPPAAAGPWYVGTDVKTTQAAKRSPQRLLLLVDTVELCAAYSLPWSSRRWRSQFVDCRNP